MADNLMLNRWLDATKELLKTNPDWKNLTVEHLLEKVTIEKIEEPKKVDHIGIAVKSIDYALPFYVNELKLTLLGIEEVSTQKVRVAFLKIGEAKLELLEPLSEESPIAQFIEKRGEGIHHVALAVDNIEERLSELKNKGVRLIHENPVLGAANAHVAFLHPKSAFGVLYEFCEKK
jgi:methylmalonyl-CoA epimerase